MGREKGVLCQIFNKHWKWGGLSDSPKLEDAQPSKDHQKHLLSWCGAPGIRCLGHDPSEAALLFSLSLSLFMKMGTVINMVTSKRWDCSPVHKNVYAVLLLRL